jgi:hypothetical protein
MQNICFVVTALIRLQTVLCPNFCLGSNKLKNSQIQIGKQLLILHLEYAFYNALLHWYRSMVQMSVPLAIVVTCPHETIPTLPLTLGESSKV